MFDWSCRAPAGRITIQVDDCSYTEAFPVPSGTVGPGRFYLFGHVETVEADGCLHFRNFKIGGETIQVILEVTNSNAPPTTAYRRYALGVRQ